MEDFVYLLAIAIVLLVAIGIFATYAPVTPPADYIPVAEFSGGYVGISNQASRTISLGSFSVGEVQKYNLRTVPQMEISSGWFGSQRKKYQISVPEWFISTKRGIRISFDVTETNRYGNLVVKWNGKEYFSKRAEEKRYSVFINGSAVKSSNSLEIYCDGPGMLFWASTVYVLKNLNVNLEYGPDRLVAFQLIPEEVSMFDRGEITFYGSGTGSMEIKVNGMKIFNVSSHGLSKAEFGYGDAPLKAGNNILTFSDRTGTYSVQDAELRIFLFNNKTVLLRQFNLTPQNFDLLQKNVMKGRIDYKVDSVIRNAPLMISINDNSLGPLFPVEGWNSADFGSAQAQEGENDIRFSSVGGYQISEIKIGLAA